MPFVGDTKVMQLTVSSDEAFAFAADPTIAITKPNGESVAAEDLPSVTVVPSTSAATQQLRAAFLFSMGGAYTIRWPRTVGDEVLTGPPQTYFAYWTDAAGVIRRRLPEAARLTEINRLDLISDAVIDPEFADTCSDLLEGTNSELRYDELSGTDQRKFDRACALTVAANLFNAVTTGGSSTPIVLEKVGQMTRQFAQISNSAAKTEPEKWIDEAARLLASLSWVAAARDAEIAANQLAGVDGRRRRALSWPCGL